MSWFITVIGDSLKLLSLPDDSMRPRCLPGTRVAVLSFILQWAANPSDKPILWLWGLAGSGKSTISATIRDLLLESRHLGCSIVFSRDVDDLKRPELVIRRWAHSLAAFDSQIAKAIDEALKEMPDIIDCPLKYQFTKLIIEPLASIEPPWMEGPIVVIIDALDECGSITKR